MRKGLITTAIILALGAIGGRSLAQTPNGSNVTETPYTLEVDSDDTGVVSYEALAARLSSELRAPVMRTTGAPPTRVAIAIRYRAASQTISVQARHTGGPTLERSIVAQGDGASVQSEAILLASNLARDEARELLDALAARAPKAPEPPPAPAPPPPPAPPPEERWAGTFGVAYPIATNMGHPDVSSVIDVSFFYGRVGRVEAFQTSFGASYASRGMDGMQLAPVVISGGPVSGVQFGIGAAIARGPTSGLQLGGGVAISDQAVDGVQLGAFATFTRGRAVGNQTSAGFNYAGAGAGGVQATSGVNIAAGPVTGAQVSGGANVAIGDVEGVQATAGANIAGGKLDGAQLSSVVNVATKEVSGVQATAWVNVAADRVDGAQLAVVNIARDVSGAQLGLVNVGRNVKGLQLGLLNIAEEVDGAAIGLVTIAKDSIHPLAWASNLAYTNVGIKFRTKYTYTLVAIGLGTNETGLDTPVITTAIGGHIPMGQSFDLEPELAYTSVNMTGDDNHAFHPRVLAGYSFAGRVRLFAGGGARKPISFDRGREVLRPEVLAGIQF
jgi:hypothetical protein